VLKKGNYLVEMDWETEYDSGSVSQVEVITFSPSGEYCLIKQYVPDGKNMVFWALESSIEESVIEWLGETPEGA
jgi:hypothetical protein